MFEKTKPIAGLRPEALNPKYFERVLFEKTNPIYSYCVVRAAYCVVEVEKTKPIVSFCVLRSEFSVKIRMGDLKKQSQITPKGVVWRPGDCCSRDIVVFEQEIWYKAYV